MSAGAIYYDNVLRTASLMTDETMTNYPTANALDGRTATQAGFAYGGWRLMQFDMGVSTAVDCIAVARHNLGTQVANIKLYGSHDNVSYPIVIDHHYANNKVHCKTFTEVSYRYYKIYVTLQMGDCYISDLFLGKGLALERNQKYGFVKPEYADGDQVIANTTRGQNLAGLNIQPGLKRCKFDLYYYTASFMASWPAVVEQLKQYPIYILWDDTEQPFYCWPTKNIPAPSYARGVYGYYDASLDMQGITE